jgi:IS1 family transposase
MKFTNTQAAEFAEIHPNRIVDHFNFLREVCSWALMRDDILSDTRLGGVNKVVQIDESVVYRAKYNRGHALFAKSKWIVGMYDVQTKHASVFFVENRNAQTLEELIKKYVLPGSTIHTDEWKGYSNIENIDVVPPYKHETVNHSKNFVDPVTGVHTQNIEAYWCSVKRKFKTLNGTSRALTASYLDEHMYRQHYGHMTAEIFNNILSHIALKFATTLE